MLRSDHPPCCMDVFTPPTVRMCGILQQQKKEMISITMYIRLYIIGITERGDA